MVAGTGKKHVNWELLNRVAANLETADANGLAPIWAQAIEVANSLRVEHSAWSHIGGAIVGPTYDQAVDQTVDNLRRGQQLFGKIAQALHDNAKLWQLCEGQNIDNFNPQFSSPYGP